jgi:hypothetical protein
MLKNRVLGFAFVATFFLVVPAIAGTLETQYNLDATVIEMVDDEVTVEDTNGSIWSFIGDEFNKGDKVELKMFTNYTDNITYDDEVIDAKVVK